MLRSSSRHFNNVVSIGSLELDYNIQNSLAQQFVRWWRVKKPTHLGTAKTKLFRVPVRPVLTEEETEELKYLHFTYKTYMRSLYAYMKEENLKLADGSKQLQEEQAKEDAHFEQCMIENDKWNEECAKVREARIAQYRLEVQMISLQKQRLSEIEYEERAREWEEKVKKEMELAKTFITEETLDDAVRNAMENFVDFNFAITFKGAKIMGTASISEMRAQELGKAPVLDQEGETDESAEASV